MTEDPNMHIVRLEEALRSEQEYLWGDLYRHVVSAANGVWSIGVESCLYRIVQIARLVGVTPWRCVQTSLVDWDIYQAVLEVANIHPGGYVPAGTPNPTAQRIRNGSWDWA